MPLSLFRRAATFICLFYLGCLPAGLSAKTLEIPGAGTPTSLVQVLADAFNAKYPPELITVPPSIGAVNGIARVTKGEVDITRVAQRLPADKMKGLTHIAIAREAIVFAGGTGVTATNLTRTQLLAIFSGKITNWKDLGGKPGPIRVFYRNPSAAVLHQLIERFPEFGTITYAKDGRVATRDFETLFMLERFDWAIGFTTLGNAQRAKNLRIFSFDGVAPTPENIASGKYPLYTEAGLIHRTGELRGLAKQFVDYVQSQEGKRIITAHGALAVRER